MRQLTHLLYNTSRYIRIAALLCSISSYALAQQPVSAPDYSHVATKWADMSLEIIRSSPANSPTYSSRSLAYLGITMYESVVHSDSAYRSLAGQLNGLHDLPKPQPGQTYNWGLVLNAGQALMLYKLYPHAPRMVMSRIDSLQHAIMTSLAATEEPAVAERSVTYGWTVAQVIFDWSRTDGGFEGFDRNFAMNRKLPVGESYWVPPVKGQSPSQVPLHVTWGNNRTFVSANGRLPLPVPLPYSKEPGSPYYKQHEAVYKKNALLTQDEKIIALWWADDPSQTAAPPGHSYNIATTVVKAAKASLVKTTETYARVGMAVADAFINCWRCKYEYFRERPSTFINTAITTKWQPFWPEPPFPAFSSGHSTQAAATATVLAHLYGDRFTITDSTHVGRPTDGLTGITYCPRQYNSFWQMAVECADSRFYGGIHTPSDNEVGLQEGKKIGNNINRLSWCH